jgi:hypothetical protein
MMPPRGDARRDSGNCARPVPELTRTLDIKLNERVHLLHAVVVLSCWESRITPPRCMRDQGRRGFLAFQRRPRLLFGIFL